MINITTTTILRLKICSQEEQYVTSVSKYDKYKDRNKDEGTCYQFCFLLREL